MKKRVLVYLNDDDINEYILKFLEMFKSKYDYIIDCIYIKDIRKYEVVPATSEGMFAGFSANYILEEWENFEKKMATKVEKFFKEGEIIQKLNIEEGITPDIIRQKMKGYDLLITGLSDNNYEDVKMLMKTYYKPFILIPKKTNYNFKKISFAHDDRVNSNKSLFYFMNLFSDIENYKFISVNIKNMSDELEKYMNIMGKNVDTIIRNGDAKNIFIEETEDMDLLIMGNLKYFFLYEKLTKRIGIKLLENIKIPIFIG